MVLLVAFSSAAILIADDGRDANIKSAEDAIWWSITTITTVGYGDRYPTTTEGRVIAMVLMLCGVGPFWRAKWVRCVVITRQKFRGGEFGISGDTSASNAN
jgi:voltage-gated potassium channel Kch